METSSFFKKVFTTYVDASKKHPFLFALWLALSALVYIAVLWQAGAINTLSWLRSGPQLEIVIKPTEKYGTANSHFTIKRVTVINEEQVIENLSIEIKAPTFIEEVRLDSDIQERCMMRDTSTTGEEAIYNIRCFNIRKDQRVEVTLFTSKSISSKEKIQVVATGSNEKGKSEVGSSATGTIE